MPPSPETQRRAGLMVRREDHQVAIVGRLERVPCCALISEADVNDAGNLTFEYAGGSTVYWDDQQPILQDGRPVYLDVNGDEVPEADVVVLMPDGSVKDPSRLRPIKAPQA